MHKNELTLEQAKIKAFRFKEILILLSTCAKIAGGLFALHIIMEGLQEIAAANPANISALSVLVKELHVSQIIAYIVAAGCASGWYMERKGKQRALPAKAAARRVHESKDPYHPSSGLTPTGETPTTEES